MRANAKHAKLAKVQVSEIPSFNSTAERAKDAVSV
jgi:hypothetical protein